MHGHRRRRAEVEGGWVSVQGEKSLEYFTIICQEAETKISILMIIGSYKKIMNKDDYNFIMKTITVFTSQMM